MIVFITLFPFVSITFFRLKFWKAKSVFLFSLHCGALSGTVVNSVCVCGGETDTWGDKEGDSKGIRIGGEGKERESGF